MFDQQSDYLKFRGACKELSEAAVAADPSLRLVRGHYYCPIWRSKEPHWWTVKEDGSINDPTKDQFPSRGMGEYVEFSGLFECAECGKQITEDEAQPYGNYVFCSSQCTCRFVGL